MLPNELLVRIFSFLPLKDLARSARVCSLWATLVNDSYIWRMIVLRNRLPSCEPLFRHYVERAHRALYAPFSNAWKHIHYLDTHVWPRGRDSGAQLLLKFASGATATSLYYDEEHEAILAGASDGKARLISLGNFLTEWEQASWEGTVATRLMLKPPRCQTFDHTTEITSVDLSDSGTLAITAGEHPAIRLWRCHRKTRGRDICRLTGHSANVFHAQFIKPRHGGDGSKILSAACDHTLKLWDVPSVTCVRTLEERQITTATAVAGAASAGVGGGGTFVVAGLGGALCGIDLSAPPALAQVFEIRRAHEYGVWCVEALDYMLVSGGMDGYIRLFDMRKLPPSGVAMARPSPSIGMLAMIKGHRGIVSALRTDGKWLVSGGVSNELLLLWDISAARSLGMVLKMFEEVSEEKTFRWHGQIPEDELLPITSSPSRCVVRDIRLSPTRLLVAGSFGIQLTDFSGAVTPAAGTTITVDLVSRAASSDGIKQRKRSTDHM